MPDLDSRHLSKNVVSSFGRDPETVRAPRKAPDASRSVSTARVLVSIQYEGRFYWIPLDTIDVRADYAEHYGYRDAIPANAAPSLLDAIVQAHELIFGDAFDAKTREDYLLIDESGMLVRILGKKGYYTCFVVNGQFSYDEKSDYGLQGFMGLGYGDTPLYDLDFVEVFSFEDSYGLDYYTYFLHPDGTWARMIRTAPGETVTVRHEGFLFGFGGPYLHEDRIRHKLVNPHIGSQLAIVNPATMELEDIEGAITDEKGMTSFAIEKPGEYLVTAHGGTTRRRHSKSSLPLLPVLVEG